jgi:hypothetical protein
MFELYNKQAEQYFTIYGISRNHNGEALFLIHLDDRWVWTHSEHFIPFHK